MATDDRSNRAALRRIAHRAMLERGFAPDFEPDVLAEVDALDPHAAGGDGDVQDLTGLPWFSIDNDDSRDLDQVSAAERLPGGAIRLFVAIADVDAFVRDGTATDGHARTNTTSIYTAGGTFPMLPERLSYDLTSLNEDGNRLALVVEMVGEAGGACRARA